MWYGPVNQDGTMRKHFIRSDDTRKQVKALGVCEGSNKPFAQLGPQCGHKMLSMKTGQFVYCTKTSGHDRAHQASSEQESGPSLGDYAEAGRIIQGLIPGVRR